jgi:hypothetical protein
MKEVILVPLRKPVLRGDKFCKVKILFGSKRSSDHTVGKNWKALSLNFHNELNYVFKLLQDSEI